ncbi:1,2-phenylacetyl-CoA epoxidase subunit PaaC [Pontibacillus salicampi]|uniref:1,2-phenylacetyl-CoA epoxidase subunit PaaC n=1 Tax=Pontibacillus salicampi TaxID=1449801 RepID=A0ABV6LK07_9BACI
MTDTTDLLSNPSYKKALIDLLYQLADDDFMVAYRGSEWLGLAPHIEEDVAFSSISQDTMGHATMFYELLEQLGEGKANDLAHGRTAAERKNAILVEEVNGPGHYLKEPHYDWAFAVARHYCYTLAKKLKMASLQQSSYEPLAHIAVKVNMELHYHLMHWQTWFTQLTSIPGEPQERMLAAFQLVCDEMQGVLHLGTYGKELAENGIIISEDELSEAWLADMKLLLQNHRIPNKVAIKMKSGNGRIGEHTEDLVSALNTLSEVYQQDPTAAW